MSWTYLHIPLRTLARDRVFAVVSIGGLALGIGASLLAFVFAWNELSYDRAFADYRSLYRISATASAPGAGLTRADPAPTDVARWLAVRLPALPVARFAEGREQPVRVGRNESMVKVSWADPLFFELFRYRAIAGDPAAALRQPDNVVLTLSLARQLFGRSAPLGETLMIEGGHQVRVAAVVTDPPVRSHLNFAIVGSSRCSGSPFYELDTQPLRPLKPWIAHTYFRLGAGIRLDQVQRTLDAFAATGRPVTGGAGLRIGLVITPIAAIHLLPEASASLEPRGSATAITGVILVGCLILLLSIVNFVNLATARSQARSIEIGIRKAAGASRPMLFVQFTIEAACYTALAALLSFAVVELSIPTFTRLAQARMSVADIYRPAVLCAALGLLLVVTVMSGGYPAWILAALRPASALRGESSYAGGIGTRRVLVAGQFAVLSALLIGVFALSAQTHFARQLARQLDTRNIFVVPRGCKKVDPRAFAALAGVVGAACSASLPLGYIEARSLGYVRPGVRTFFSDEPVDSDFFVLYGIRPIAGRLFDRAHGADAVVERAPGVRSGPVVINATAVHRFGFSSPAAAVGQIVNVLGDRGTGADSQIIGVIADLPSYSLREQADAAVFYLSPKDMDLLSIKVSGPDAASALANVERLWRQLTSGPMDRVPADRAFQGLYREVQADEAVFSACVALACVLACAGLYGLAAFIANRRRRELGVRKALGAGRRHLFLMLIWQLTKPILWAQLIVWPLCYLLLRRWLEGFTQHVELPLQAFGLSALIVLGIAWLTAGLHIGLAAIRRPVASLRYE